MDGLLDTIEVPIRHEANATRAICLFLPQLSISAGHFFRWNFGASISMCNADNVEIDEKTAARTRFAMVFILCFSACNWHDEEKKLN